MLQPTHPFGMLSKGLVLALVLVIGVALLPLTQVAANGPHPGSREVFTGEVDPYDVRVLAVTTAGNFHMTVYLSQLGSGEPVGDARIQVVGMGPSEDPQTVGPSYGQALPLVGPNIYSVTVPVEEAGDWMFTIMVDSALGEATVDFPVEVRESGGIGWIVIVLGGVFLAMVLGFGLRRWWPGRVSRQASRRGIRTRN